MVVGTSQAKLTAGSKQNMVEHDFIRFFRRYQEWNPIKANHLTFRTAEMSDALFILLPDDALLFHLQKVFILYEFVINLIWPDEKLRVSLS